MKDRRSIDDLSVGEIERVLAEKKRAAREARLTRYRTSGRAVRLTVGDTASGLSEPVRRERAPRSPARRLFDWFLLVVEIGAVVGLLLIAAQWLQEVSKKQALNQELGQAMAQSGPTPSPTPLVTVVVLPGGHTPPDPSTGLTQFNESEIPSEYWSLANALPPLGVPTQGPSQARRIVIPAIDVDAPVVQGDTWDTLKQGVGQHIGSADPGQTGNMVLSAHNDVFGQIFMRLDELQPGDEIQLYTISQVFTYIVTRTDFVEPTDVSVMDITPYPSITLISCYPYLVDTQRIVVRGELKTQ